ncbi:MAG: carbon-nitrogen hydrolase family protein [Bacteriovoracaceae bacterium]|jgi:predicted amidohydrolase|nr:carbon-nitrogen hydrolase family protein [Bacteriovoracaceae bacterium]
MKVAIIQICSVLDYKVNLKKIDKLIKQAISEKNAKYIFLAEAFYSMSDGTVSTPYLIEKGNEHYKNIQELAIENKIYLIGGSAATLVNGKVMNRAYCFDPFGNEIAYYDKIHLFRIEAGHTKIDEGDVYSSGKSLKTFKLDNEFKVGLSICFDIRFSEIYRKFYKEGVNLITAASAFTVPTGKAHWETLLRARAIETQSYVVAADQVGIHNDKISTYGHSMIIDPWGKVLANAKEKEGYIFAELKLEEIKKVRSRVNVDPQLSN